MILSDVWRLSVAYIGPKSRTETPMKTKIGTEVADVTHDSGTTFKVRGQGHRGGGILWRPTAQLVLEMLQHRPRVILWSLSVLQSLIGSHRYLIKVCHFWWRSCPWKLGRWANCLDGSSTRVCTIWPTATVY